jgi:oxygen-dependent protoporphyrinogen oxidase
LSDLAVAVIGGGITGLAAAWQLACTAPPGTRVVLLEADDRLGGKLRTGEIGGRPVELGPDAFLVRRHEAFALCEELGLGPEMVAPASSRAFVWARGRLRALPAGMALGVPTRLGPLARSGICSGTGLGRAALDLLAPAPRHKAVHSGDEPDAAQLDDETVGSVVRRHLGNQVHDRLADPLIGGIHAGAIDTMSAAAVFPELLRADRRAGSLMRGLRPPKLTTQSPVFMTVRGGLESLAQHLRAALEERGVEIRLGTAVKDLQPQMGRTQARCWSLSTEAGDVEADGVLLAIPAVPAALLLRRLDSTLADLLDGIPYSSVTLVTLRFAAEAVASPLDGTGFLVPVAEGRLITACTFLSSKWAHIAHTDDVLLRASIGRYGDDRQAKMSEEEVVRGALRDLRRMLDLRDDPIESVVTRWPGAFPQYLVGHLRRVRSIEERVDRLGGLAVAGAALHGVGIPACVGSGRSAAELLLGTLVAERR